MARAAVKSALVSGHTPGRPALIHHSLLAWFLARVGSGSAGSGLPTTVGSSAAVGSTAGMALRLGSCRLVLDARIDDRYRLSLGGAGLMRQPSRRPVCACVSATAGAAGRWLDDRHARRRRCERTTATLRPADIASIEREPKDQAVVPNASTATCSRGCGRRVRARFAAPGKQWSRIQSERGCAASINPAPTDDEHGEEDIRNRVVGLPSRPRSWATPMDGRRRGRTSPFPPSSRGRPPVVVRHEPDQPTRKRPPDERVSGNAIPPFTELPLSLETPESGRSRKPTPAASQSRIEPASAKDIRPCAQEVLSVWRLRSESPRGPACPAKPRAAGEQVALRAARALSRSIDGKVGPKTVAAVRVAQRRPIFRVNGVIDTRTRKSLGPPAAAAEDAVASTRQLRPRRLGGAIPSHAPAVPTPARSTAFWAPRWRPPSALPAALHLPSTASSGPARGRARRGPRPPDRLVYLVQPGDIADGRSHHFGGRSAGSSGPTARYRARS